MPAVLVGAAGGLGIAGTLFLALAPTRPALAALLTRASERPAPVPVNTPAGVGAGGLVHRFLTAVGHRLDVAWLKSPDTDLNVIEKSRQQYLLERLGWALLGLLFVPLLGVFLWVAGVGLPPAIPALGSIALAALFWAMAAGFVTTAAQLRRREMRYSLAFYEFMVALYRWSGEGSASSLELAARMSDSWAFRRIDRQVSAALRSTKTEWQALSELAEEMDIEEFATVASITENASVLGAHVGPTLVAHAASLRRELMAKEQTSAAESTNTMAFPKMLIGLVIVVFLFFPPLYTLATSS